MNTLDSFLHFIQRLTHVNVQLNEYFHLAPNFPRVHKVLTSFFTFFYCRFRHCPVKNMNKVVKTLYTRGKLGVKRKYSLN